MKRALRHSQEENVSQTPSKSTLLCLKPPGKSISKRARVAGQGNIRSFFQDETPTASVPTKPCTDVWPSSAQRKFANLGIHTPLQAAGLPGPDTNADSNVKEPTRNASTDTDFQAHSGDFVLFSQNDYVRASQAVGTPELQPCNDTQVASTTFLGFMSQRSQPYDEHFGFRTRQPQSQLPTPGVNCGHAEDDAQIQAASQTQSHMSDMQLSQPAVHNTSEAHATTPELDCCVSNSEGKQNESASRGSKPAKMFNIFLPVNQQRYLILIRHGESEYNRAVLEGSDFKDPMIFDPHLTARGVIQARELRSKLQHQLAAHGDALWVLSPLRRAIQTFLEGCPLLHGGPQLPSSGAACHGGPAAASTHDQLAKLRVQMMPMISEFVATAGDIGTRASMLAEEFPALSQHLAKIPEQWWFQAPKKPNCAVQKQFSCSEPKERRQKRVSELARWLSNRPEKFIIMVGHCSFWHEFKGRTQKRMANGEMRCMRW